MLYIVATPIGNMGDITVRALETLKSVDVIAAEDTRHTLGLLTHYGISKPLISYFEHNKASREGELIARLRDGQDIALVSDAGMPGISDPGHDLIARALREGLDVTVVPGACAGVTAMVLSGFNTQHFVFHGFIGTGNKERKEFFSMLTKESRPVIVYEAPHRFVKTLEEFKSYFDEAGQSERKIAACRELTKKFEEIKRGTAQELIEYFTANEPRGEFVLVIDEWNEAISEIKMPSDTEILDMVNQLANKGIKRNDAMRQIGERLNLTKNQIYSICERAKNL